MTLEADTLAELTEALQQRGLVMVAQVKFTRAPYRHDHHWICSVA